MIALFVRNLGYRWSEYWHRPRVYYVALGRLKQEQARRGF